MDNSSSHNSNSYDMEILKTIPYYQSIHKETLLLIKSLKINPELWLDTGCGTGTFINLILNDFQNTNFVLADPSKEMLNITKDKLSKQPYTINYIESDTTSLDLKKNSFDIITAIQSHHYLHKKEREKATKKCYNLLKKNGIYITFENTKPSSKESAEIFKEYWKQFQITNGKSLEEAAKHLKRFNQEYFPITVNEHIKLYKKTGFRIVDILWKSYIQTGFICIK